jgi:hypothetical protein
MEDTRKHWLSSEIPLNCSIPEFLEKAGISAEKILSISTYRPKAFSFHTVSQLENSNPATG